MTKTELLKKLAQMGFNVSLKGAEYACDVLIMMRHYGISGAPMGKICEDIAAMHMDKARCVERDLRHFKEAYYKTVDNVHETLVTNNPNGLYAKEFFARLVLILFEEDDKDVLQTTETAV
jgi:hypothetical protein